MKRIPTIVLTALALGLMAALVTVSGCSEAARRTLTLFQFQSSQNTYTGPFRIDVSQLPPEAVQSRTETGGPGKPETRLTLNMDYEVEIVLRLVEKNGKNLQQAGDTPPSDANR
jgi:hypothetical protein